MYDNTHISLEAGLKRVQDGNFAFQVVLATAYNHILKTFTNYDICKLQELPGYMNVRLVIHELTNLNKHKVSQGTIYVIYFSFSLSHFFNMHRMIVQLLLYYLLGHKVPRYFI